ncbi:hypothetical protein ACIA6C_12775 [Streptomyces sp. NPDC051578]|uniref:hypothetical protein n=1 Tax=Streptomyces sp. NPDC051578 TaxID=3365662 RepID=UPI0037BE14FC
MSDYPPPQAEDEEPAPARGRVAPPTGPTTSGEAGAGSGSADTPAGAVDDEGLRMLLQTAVAHRPLEEVADLVTLLRRSGQVPDAANEALRAAALSRPVEDVVSLALLLSREEEPEPHPDRIGEGDEAPVRRASRKRAKRPRPARAPGHGLRWPTAAALTGSALLYLPRHPSHLLAEGGAGTWLLLGIVAVCTALAVCLAVRDRTRVWAGATVAGLGILAVHGLAAMTGLSLLRGAVGGLLPWSTGIAVLMAALGALLAGMALLYRSEQPSPVPPAPEPVRYELPDSLEVIFPDEVGNTAEAETTAP